MTWLRFTQLLEQPLADRPIAEGWSHADFRRDGRQLATALQAAGIERLGVHLDDAAELGLLLVAAWHAGIVVHLPADLQAASLRQLAGTVDLLLTDAQTATVAEAAPPTASWRTWLVARSSAAAAAPTAALRPLAVDAPALVVHTSGSSGQPKPIVKSLAQLESEAQALEARWGATIGDACILGSVSPQHIYGLTFRVVWPLLAGRCIDRVQHPFPEALLAATARLAGSPTAPRPIVWIGSPALYRRMGEQLDWALAAGRVCRLFSAGGPLPPEAARQLQARLGHRPIDIYGSTETGVIGWRQDGETWTPFDGVEVGLCDPAGTLWVRSPWLAAGATEQTADAAQLTRDGFRLLGRTDRIVKLEERRVALARIESALQAHDWLAEVRCGVFRQGRASIGAVAVLSEAGIATLRRAGRKTVIEGLQQALEGRVEAFAWPRRWRWVTALPWSTQGKLPQARIDQLLARPRPRLPEAGEPHRDPGAGANANAGADAGWTIELKIPPDLIHFAGHFPSAPVLPAVVQIEWALDWVARLWSVPAQAREFEVLKFQRLIRPADSVRLRLSRSKDKFVFAFQSDQGPCSSGRILIDAEAQR